MLAHVDKEGGRGGLCPRPKRKRERGLSLKEFSNSIHAYLFPEFLRFGDGFGLKSRRVLWIEYHHKFDTHKQQQ
jgi:hypothetical protein